MEAFYPGARAWTALPASAMPAPRNDFGAAVLGSSVLVMEGMTGFAWPGAAGEVWRFDQTGAPHAFSGAWSNASAPPSTHGVGSGGWGPVATTVEDDAGAETVFILDWSAKGWKCVGAECFNATA